MRRWIGKAIVAIGIIHSLFGMVVFRGTLGQLWQDGLVNSVNGQTDRELAFWFISFGPLVIVLGALIDCWEGTRVHLPSFLGWSLLGMTVVMLTIMPISGVWLMAVPAIGAIHRSRSTVARNTV